MNPKLHICLPVLNESENLPKFIDALEKQSYTNFILYICVNQPDDWWSIADKRFICEDNSKSLAYLNTLENLQIEIIDKSSPGKAWVGKKKGVGWARKTVMDRAADNGALQDILVSVDADTFYPEHYLQSIVDVFNRNQDIIAHSNPYYHPLTNRLAEDKAILRYELYMRIYAINMLHIDNPYAFSAIGSGMATTIKQYKRVGGMSPKASGEDFYFIQRMRKTGVVSNYNQVKIYPQARFSDRVYFGTGPAMIKGDAGDWNSYPFYLPELFAQVKSTYDFFKKLHQKDLETPMTVFLQQQLKRNSLWASLRKNHKTKEAFSKAAMELVDGLRILQYLKEMQKANQQTDEHNLLNNLQFFTTFDTAFKNDWKEPDDEASLLSFENMKVLRDLLTELEYRMREKESLKKK